MLKNFQNKYSIDVTINYTYTLDSNDQGVENLKSEIIGGYTIAKNPLQKKENIHKISFNGLPDFVMFKLQEYKTNNAIHIKVRIKNLVTGNIILNNYFRIIGLSEIKNGPGYTSIFDLYLVGLIPFKLRQENLLSSVTLSENPEEPIAKVEFSAYEMMKKMKNKLEERHGNTLAVNLTNKNSASNFVFEYIKIPSSIPDISAFDYVNNQYYCFFFPQFFFVDDMALTRKNNIPTLFRQIDLGLITLEEYDIYSEDSKFNNIRKYIKKANPFLDWFKLNKEISKTLHLSRNNEIDDLVVHKDALDANATANMKSDSNLTMDDKDIYLGNTNELPFFLNQENHDIIITHEEFKKFMKAKEIFINGGEKEFIPQFETWEINDTCPWELNFDYKYNFTKNKLDPTKKAFEYIPIDFVHVFYKLPNENDTFVINSEASFYVSSAQNLLNDLLGG